MRSLIKKARLLAGMTQVEVAKAVGVSQPTYQRWESGASSVPKSKTARLAKILGMTQPQVAGQPEPFDLLGVNPDVSDERKYFGEIAIHFCSGLRSLLLPVTEAERSRFMSALQEQDAFLQLESLDNRMVFVRRRAIADVFFSSEAYDTYGPEKNYGSQHLGVHPDESFWQIVEHLDCPEYLADEFSQQEIQEVIQKMSLEDAELDELVANGRVKPEEREKVKKEAKEMAELYMSRACDVTWQMSGHANRSFWTLENKDLYESLSTLEFGEEKEMLYLNHEGYHREIFINLSAIDYIAAPAHKFRQGELESAAQYVDGAE